MIQISSLEHDLNLIREKSPLVHNITNYVVMNNTANALLAIGASPVMAHAVNEVAEMTSIASALVINIGTLEDAWVEGMFIAGESALKKGIPVIFDPVGAGATSYRNEVCKKIIKVCKPTIIRGNPSEIISLYNTNARTKGVDSLDSSDSALDSARALAQETGAVVVISGQTDYITDGMWEEMIQNGNPMMARVTGMGCTATAMVAAFAAINPDPLKAATHAMAIMGIAGERATAYSKGTGSLQVNFLDELYSINADRIKETIRLW